MFVINDNQGFISQIYRVVRPLGEKLHFCSPLGFKAESNFDHKTPKLQPHTIRASERYLNDKNPILGRETVSSFRFSAENFVFLLTEWEVSAGIYCLRPFSVLTDRREVNAEKVKGNIFLH